MYKDLERIHLDKIETLAEKSDYWKNCLRLIKLAKTGIKLSVKEQQWLRRIAREHNEEYFKKINYDMFLN